MGIKCLLEHLESIIFICNSKSDVKKIIKETKNKCKYCVQAKGTLLDDTVVYGVLVGNQELPKSIIYDFIDDYDFELLNSFSKSE